MHKEEDYKTRFKIQNMEIFELTFRGITEVHSRKPTVKTNFHLCTAADVVSYQVFWKVSR